MKPSTHTASYMTTCRQSNPLPSYMCVSSQKSIGLVLLLFEVAAVASMLDSVSEVGHPGPFCNTLDGELARNVFEEATALPEYDRDKVKLQLVEETGTYPLPDCPTAVQTDIFPVRGPGCLLYCGFEAVGDEMKSGSLADIVSARLMGEDEDGHLERWARPPGGLSVVIAVFAHNQGTGSFEFRAQDVVRGELFPVGDIVGEPSMQGRTAFAHRVL